MASLMVTFMVTSKIVVTFTVALKIVDMSSLIVIRCIVGYGLCKLNSIVELNLRLAMSYTKVFSLSQCSPLICGAKFYICSRFSTPSFLSFLE